MQDLLEFFQFSPDIFEWRFITILVIVISLGLLLPSRWTKPFRSVRFNVWLFTVIAIASAIGTLIPQNKPFDDSVAKFGEFWANVFENLGLFNIYHTWWFCGLLALMAFDVIVCKLKKLPKTVFGPPPDDEKDSHESVSHILKRASHRDELSSSYGPDQTIAKLKTWLKENKYTFRQARWRTDKKEGTILYAGRHYFQMWGDFILHVSIVGILAGSFLGALIGFEEALPVVENSRAKMERRNYEIELRDFEIEYYSSTGVPSLYASDIIVRKNGKVLGEKRIVVNDPLDIDGIRFYQASWGMTDQFKSAKLFIGGDLVELKQGEIKSIPGTPYNVRANSLAPTFDIDDNLMPVTRDYEGSNMALQMDFLDNDKVIGQVWVLKDRPNMAFRVVGNKVQPTQPPPFQIAEINPILFSGIQIGYDPGAALFWVFSLILLFGLCIHFYMHQRRLRFLIVQKGQASSLHIGGWNSRAPQDFQYEFTKGVDEIRKLLSAPN